MSVIALATVKAYLRVTHTDDDALLQTLLDSAEAEAMRYMNRTYLPGANYELPEDSSSEVEVDLEQEAAPDVVVAVVLLVACEYEAQPDDRATLRRAAETKLMPYRTEMGC